MEIAHTSCVAVVKSTCGGFGIFAGVEIGAASLRFSMCSFHPLNRQLVKSAIVGRGGDDAIKQDACD
jgi:hypothetical protein